MPRFRFDPVSLVLEMPEPAVEAFREMEVEEGVREAADFNGRYLHERIHWIQHFSTFSGLLQVVNAELQQFVLEQAMARLEKSPLPSTPPFRTAWRDQEEMLVWEALELFGAAMAGDRRRAHFETVYDSGWPTRLLQGAQLFSRNVNTLRENGFRFDVQTKTDFPGLSVGAATFFEDEGANATGSSLLFELHAGLAQLGYLQTVLDEFPRHAVDPVDVLPRRVVELRDQFRDEASLPEDWRSDIVCSIAAYFALNTPVAPFFPILTEKENLTDISPIPRFFGMATRLAPLRVEIERAPCADILEFHAFALDLLARCVGHGFFEINLQLLGMVVGQASYRPLGSKERKILSFENDRPQYLAATAGRLVQIAREDPIFVTCPGHLYTVDRKRFGKLYSQISHPLEYRREIGICPSPHLSRRSELSEYARQVAFAFKAELCRALAHADLNHAMSAVHRWKTSHPAFRDLHMLGLRAGLHDLVLPADIRQQVVSALAL